jgi:hypothetical protein
MVMTASAATAHSPPPTPASVGRSLEREGPKRTIDDLARTDEWDFVANRMDTGASAWIGLAPRLAPGSDAGSAEDLGISLAFALPINPRAVLAALDPHDGYVLGASRVCGMPFIEETVKDRPAYRRRAIAAVQAVTERRLSGARTACLRSLRAAR